MTVFDVILQLITAFFGTLGFGLLFNIHGLKLWLGALGGLLCWGAFLLLGLFIPSEILRYLIVSVLIASYSEILARKIKTPATVFCMVSLIPLIPGGSLYYSVAYALDGDWISFFPKILHTLELAAALSAGILLVTAAMRAVGEIRTRGKSDL